MAAKAGKDLGFSILLDYYGMVLTEKQRNILTEYYNDDLSLAEIAENYGITRQGVRDAIKHGEATLMEMEEKLGTARRTEAFGQILPGWKSLSARCACAILGCLNRIPAFSGLPRRC